MYHTYLHFTGLWSTPKTRLQQSGLKSDFLQLGSRQMHNTHSSYFFLLSPLHLWLYVFLFVLNIMITTTDYRAMAQGNVFKHHNIIRKKYIYFRTSNNLQCFVETGDLKMADHCKIWKLRLSPPPPSSQCIGILHLVVTWHMFKSVQFRHWLETSVEADLGCHLSL